MSSSVLLDIQASLAIAKVLNWLEILADAIKDYKATVGHEKARRKSGNAKCGTCLTTTKPKAHKALTEGKKQFREAEVRNSK